MLIVGHVNQTIYAHCVFIDSRSNLFGLRWPFCWFTRFSAVCTPQYILVKFTGKQNPKINTEYSLHNFYEMEHKQFTKFGPIPDCQMQIQNDTQNVKNCIICPGDSWYNFNWKKIFRTKKTHKFPSQWKERKKEISESKWF